MIALGVTPAHASTITVTDAAGDAVGTGDPEYDFQGHVLDGFRDMIGVEVAFGPTGWAYHPRIGHYDATRGNATFEPDSSMAGKWSVSATAHTITVTIVTRVTSID